MSPYPDHKPLNPVEAQLLEIKKLSDGEDKITKERILKVLN